MKNKQQADTPVVPVVLRVWRPEGGALALFPTLPSDNYGHYCNSYEHIGQHGGADYYGCLQKSRPAKGEEAAELTRELKRIGYRLRVVKRATPAMHDERKAEARRVRDAMRE